MDNFAPIDKIPRVQASLQESKRYVTICTLQLTPTHVSTHANRASKPKTNRRWYAYGFNRAVYRLINGTLMEMRPLFAKGLSGKALTDRRQLLRKLERLL